MEEEREQGADIIVLKDEEGRDVRFEFQDLLEYDGEEYVILMQEDDDSGEVVILRLEGEDEEGEDYVAVKTRKPWTRYMSSSGKSTGMITILSMNKFRLYA